MQAQKYPWLRYWCRRGDRPVLQEDFLVPPDQKTDWFSPSQTTPLKTLPQLAEVPCLVLLGDPGTGKSNEIAAEAIRLTTPKPAGVEVKRLDLKLRTHALIEKEVFARPEFIGWTEGKHALVLFFDSMDECWRRVPELGPVLLSELDPHLKKKLLPLYLRLGCRVAEWREEIETELREVFGEAIRDEKVQVWELAPLMVADVREAAKASGLDEAKFLAEVKARDVNAFAAHPITLKMLLATAQGGSALGRDRAEIYQKGCTLLCQDEHQPEKSAPRLKSTTAERFACASYLAALCVLSNRYLIFGSAEKRPADETGVIAGMDLLGQRTLIAGSDVEFTREILAETLLTGLFDAQSGELFSWRHQSYAEYLAANYLQARAVPAAEICQSLCDTTSGEPRLWPQVEETACWLATLVPDVFKLLVGANAEVFVRCDPARLGAEQREQIVAGYLAQVRGHQAEGARDREVSRLNRLAHPKLVAQLAPILTNAAEDIFVRDLAMDIVRACELRELTDLLITMVFTPGAPQRLRHGAGVTLREWADATLRAKVKQQLKPELLDDDDVRGCVLGILWPAELTSQELVPFLTKPAKSNYIGSYQIFLGETFRAGLPTADLLPLIAWARKATGGPDHPDRGQYHGACSAVLLAAFHAIDKPAVRAALIAVVEDRVRQFGTLFKTEGRNLAEELPARKTFWRALVAGDRPMRQTVISASLRESGLLQEDDFDWIVDEATAAGPQARDRWLELAFWLFQPLRRLDQLSRMTPFAESDAAVAERLRLYTTSNLFEKDGTPNYHKTDYERKEKREAQRAQRKPFRQLIDDLIGNYESTKQPNAIWGLVHRLSDPVREYDEPGGYNMGEIGWKHLTDEQRARMLAFAADFISSVTVNLAEVYEKERFYRSYVAGTVFLLDLIAAGSPWPAAQSSEFWSGWTEVVIKYDDHVHHVDDETWQKLLQLAFQKAKPAFLTGLGKWFGARGDRHTPVKRLELLPVSSDPDVEALFLDHALSLKRNNDSAFEFFGFLLKQKSEKTLATLLSWRRVPGSPAPEGAPLAEALLLCYQPGVLGRQVIDGILADVAWGRSVFFHLSHMTGVRSNWLTMIDVERLARLWEWLDKEFPGDPYDDDKGDGTVTATHEISIFRSHLISYIEKQGTDEAVEALRGLTLRHADYPWLGRILAQAREILRRESWHPPTSREAIAYLARNGKPPLTNDADLADAVKASLLRYQDILKGPTPPTELWNEPVGPVKGWSPKDEENISDCLARHLERDLRLYNIHAARESELRQGTGGAAGDEPDLLVTAPTAAGDGQKLTVVVEVKGTWNLETVSGMEKQLLHRYLRSARCGIYVAGHFKCASWTEEDYRQKQGWSRKTLAEVSDILEAERTRLAATTAKRLDLVVIDAAV